MQNPDGHTSIGIFMYPYIIIGNTTVGTLVFVTVRVLLLEVPGICAHVFDAIFCFPAKFFFGFCCIRVACSYITCTAWFDRIRNLYACSCFKVLNDIQCTCSNALTLLVYSGWFSANDLASRSFSLTFPDRYSSPFSH